MSVGFHVCSLSKVTISLLICGGYLEHGVVKNVSSVAWFTFSAPTNLFGLMSEYLYELIGTQQLSCRDLHLPSSTGLGQLQERSFQRFTNINH